MHITSITYRKKKRGVSTVLGTLIFIGILFTSVIPMLLVMKQADTIYAQKVHEREKLDEEVASEEIEVYAYPVTEDGDDIKVTIKNQGVVPVKIVRVWINDDYNSTSTSISPFDNAIFGPYNVTPVDGASYEIKVATEGGNGFASINGKLYYGEGGWLEPELGICVTISVFLFGRYRIKVTNTTWDSGWWESGWTLGDVIHTFNVSKTGTYQVFAERRSWSGGYTPLAGTPVLTTITYPNGPPVVSVNIKG